MSSRGETVVKLRMTPYFWRLLGKYCAILAYRTVLRGQPPMSIVGTVSGIVSNHLAKYAPWIDYEYERIREESIHNEAVKFFGADYLDAVASASSAQIPDVVRACQRPSLLRKALSHARPLLGADRKPKRPSGRPRKKAGALRDGGSRAPAGAEFGPEDPRWAEFLRDGSIGSGDGRLESKLLAAAFDTREDSSGPSLSSELEKFLGRDGRGRQ